MVVDRGPLDYNSGDCPAAIGAILTLALAASGRTMNLDTFYFARRQLLALPVAIGVMLASPSQS